MNKRKKLELRRRIKRPSSKKRAKMLIAGLLDLLEERSQPLDKLSCPFCGSDIVWGCPFSTGSTTIAHCGKGLLASRVDFDKKSCRWSGTPIFRGLRGDMYFVLPISTRRFPK